MQYRKIDKIMEFFNKEINFHILIFKNISTKIKNKKYK